MGISASDITKIMGEAASTIDGLERRNEVLEAQVRVVRIFEMALGRNDGGMHSERWSMGDRLRMAAKEIEAQEKAKATATSPATV